MLESLFIKNFQTHENLRIDFDPLITTVIGPSDRGKSAVIRALRWLATNRPGGSEFIRYGTETVKVTLKIDGRKIRRTKGKARNSYHLDGAPLVAFGSDVPRDVAKLLNFGEINCQQQHDPPFWFAASAGEVSKRLNEIINLGVIDSSLAFLNNATRRTTTEISICEERLVTARAAKSALKTATGMDADLTGVEGLANQASAARLAANDVRLLAEGGVAIAQRTKATAECLLLGNQATKAGEKWSTVETRREGLSALLDAADLYAPIAARPRLSAGRLERLAGTAAETDNKRVAVAILLRHATEHQAQQVQSTAVAKMLELELKKKIGAICPLCNQKIKR